MLDASEEFMRSEKVEYASIDEYVASFPDDVQKILESIRATIKAAAPDAEEKISYQLPTFTLHGILLHFGAWRNHIGLYPAPSGIREFQKELSKYVSSKGAVQFPLDQPMPLRLIREIVKFRVAENLAKAEKKKSVRKKNAEAHTK
jgi:uncharacterized protein YdhG (YjbR/CyaY superfamily)